MTINEAQQNIIDEFSAFDEWMDKYAYLIEIGKDLPLIDAQHRVEQNIIKGCQSNVWLYAEMEGENIIFKADSDAIITKGIINLLIKVLSNHTPDEIINADLFFVDEIGLKEHLSPTRANGLVAMIKQMKLYAIAYKTKQNQ